MTGLPETHERLAILETQFDAHKEAQEQETKILKDKVAALERFQVMVMTGLAAVGAVVTFCAEKLRKVLGL
ncbi:MAG: hypothetical protein LCH78_18160 [Proteobacteria bacterium]|nr:hypothetical protein [Pseudomonadota bacterium]